MINRCRTFNKCYKPESLSFLAGVLINHTIKVIAAYIITMPAIVLVTTAVLPFVRELIITNAIITASKNR